MYEILYAEGVKKTERSLKVVQYFAVKPLNSNLFNKINFSVT